MKNKSKHEPNCVFFGESSKNDVSLLLQQSHRELLPTSVPENSCCPMTLRINLLRKPQLQSGVPLEVGT
jgi:hypothetical protein